MPTFEDDFTTTGVVAGQNGWIDSAGTFEVATPGEVDVLFAGQPLYDGYTLAKPTAGVGWENKDAVGFPYAAWKGSRQHTDGRYWSYEIEHNSTKTEIEPDEGNELSTGVRVTCFEQCHVEWEVDGVRYGRKTNNGYPNGTDYEVTLLGSEVAAPAATYYPSTNGYFEEGGWIWTDASSVPRHDDNPALTQYIKNQAGRTTTAFARRTHTDGSVTLSALQTFSHGTLVSIGKFVSTLVKFEYVEGTTPAETGGPILCAWTRGTAPTGGGAPVTGERKVVIVDPSEVVVDRFTFPNTPKTGYENEFSRASGVAAVVRQHLAAASTGLWEVEVTAKVRDADCWGDLYVGMAFEGLNPEYSLYGVHLDVDVAGWCAVYYQDADGASVALAGVNSNVGGGITWDQPWPTEQPGQEFVFKLTVNPTTGKVTVYINGVGRGGGTIPAVHMERYREAYASRAARNVGFAVFPFIFEEIKDTFIVTHFKTNLAPPISGAAEPGRAAFIAPAY